MNAEYELRKDIGGFSKDPLRFVKYAFPWGTGELESESGPDEWQTGILEAVRDGLLSAQDAIRAAVASGHGIGKSCLVSWLMLWSLSTFEDTRGVVTANTEVQLRTKTWAELAKWYRLLICKHWFEMTATAIFARDPSHSKTWRIDAVAWSERNTEAFAGLHNAGRRVVLIYDEASSIPDIIWETSEGAMTDADTQILWFAFGNPTRNTGRFRECFGRFRHRWLTRHIDSRTAKKANKAQLEQWVSDYGEDSDFVRVRVRGVFPRAGSMQFIASDIAEGAAAPERDPPVTLMDPCVMGVDVARFGGAASVICIRRGRDARTVPWIILRGVDTMQLAARVVDEARIHKPDAIFVDGGGVGGGVVDRLRYLKQPVIEVQFGGKSDRASTFDGAGTVYANKRAEMWGAMREWLKVGAIPTNMPELQTDLTGVEYGYVLREGKDAIQLERKEDMAKRGLSSPDHADALALTWAYPVEASDHTGIISRRGSHHVVDYNPMASAWTVKPGQNGPQREPRQTFYTGKH